MWWEMDGENQKISEQALNTADIYKGLSLPKRIDSPYQFTGYGSQQDGRNPIYRTSNADYGYYPPCPHTVPHKYFPKSHKFTGHLYQCGMFRNYSLNTAVDRPYCKFNE
ncbi:piercer of microtubule wall 1 protein [Anopheles moucheti]|uniref:piercer of microtubule wall 1 protein n=1 Tax=Anopheles moucheti TaxID=186751 RepID=UPI0022F0C50A|nr:piercer of microtubule wall 1 protein [Anopheles moucheti]